MKVGIGSWIILIVALMLLWRQRQKAMLSFDPWSYDSDGDGVISISDYLAAVNDWKQGVITEQQAEQVKVLWKTGVRG